MFTADFLTGHSNDGTDLPNEIVPIALMLKEIFTKWEKIDRALS